MAAHAQNVPAAEALYDRGVADFQAGRYELACQELADSYRLEALPGVLFTLATCEARAGRVASSAAHFQDFLQLVSRLPDEQRALQREREQVALRERKALLPAIPTLTVSVNGELPPGAVVQCDGAVLGPSSLDKPLPLDPGAHVLILTLADGTRLERPTVLARAAHERVVFELPQQVPERRAEQPVPVQRPSRYRRSMIAGGVLGGVGLLSGAALGTFAFLEKRVVDDYCTGTVCDARGERAADQGRLYAHLSSGSFAVGAVGLATLLVSHLTHRRGRARSESRAQLVLTPRGVLLGARF